MGTADEDELERLHRAAFTRGATDQDLEALADALAVEQRTRQPEPAPSEEPAPESADASEPTAASRAPLTARRAWTLRAAVLGVVALLAGGAGGWTLHDVATGPPESATLAAFSGLPVVDNPWPDALTHADSRLLGETSGMRFVGSTGSAPDTFPGPSGSLVCLMVLADDLDAGACTPLERFLAEGVSFSVAGPDGPRTFHWGPDGPPGMVACAPEAWLVTCPAGFSPPSVPTLAP